MRSMRLLQKHNRAHCARRIGNASGMTLMELVIATGLASLLLMITIQILNISSNSMSTVRAITTFEGFKTQLASQMAVRANCAKILGALHSPPQNLPLGGGPVTISLYSVVDGTTLNMVGASPAPTQNMAGAGVQITAITLQPISGGGGFSAANLVGSSNVVAGSGSAATNLVLANMTLTAQIAGANTGANSVTSTFASSSLTENIGLMLELDSANNIVSCSSQNADSVKPYNLPICKPGSVLVFSSPNPGVPPFWRCMVTT